MTRTAGEWMHYGYMWRCAFVLSCCASVVCAQDAKTITKRISERYKQLGAIRIEGTYQVVSRLIDGPARSMQSDAKFLIVADPSGSKRHLEFKGPDLTMTLITDGSHIWTVLPERKAFTKVDASATVTPEDDAAAGDSSGASTVEILFGALTRHYVQFDRLAAQTELAGEQELKLAEGKRRCIVLQTKFPNQAERNWVDAETGLIRKTEEAFRHGNVETHVTVTARIFEAGDTPDADLFTFTPRPKDKEVDELAIPGVAPVFVGKRAADFSLKDEEGERVSLADFRGKVVVLDFWATWCPPCRHELPTIDKLAAQLKDQGVVFLGINDEGNGTVKSFNRKYNYTFKTLQDSGDKLHHAYLATAIPNVFVIGKDGIIRKHFVGSREEPELLAAVQAAGKP